MMNKLHKQLLAALVGLGLCASAFAMPPSSGDVCDQGGPRHGRMRAERMDPAKRAEHMKSWMAQRQAALHDRLQLNADQEIAWKAYIAGAVPTEMPMRMQRDEMLKLSAPERMEKMLGMMKDRQAHMESRLAALKKFYAVLTPEQQKIFDAEIGPRHRAGQGKRGGKRAM